MLSLCAVLASFQTHVGADYYTGEYDYTTVDGNQPETPTETAGQGQVTFLIRVFFAKTIIFFIFCQHKEI